MHLIDNRQTYDLFYFSFLVIILILRIPVIWLNMTSCHKETIDSFAFSTMCCSYNSQISFVLCPWLFFSGISLVFLVDVTVSETPFIPFYLLFALCESFSYTVVSGAPHTTHYTAGLQLKGLERRGWDFLISGLICERVYQVKYVCTLYTHREATTTLPKPKKLFFPLFWWLSFVFFAEYFLRPERSSSIAACSSTAALLLRNFFPHWKM